MYTPVEVKGKNGISAKIIKHSESQESATEVITFEIEFPRWILAEVNTHKMLSKNTASSRAIPVAKYIEKVQTDPAVPVYWGKNIAGMSAKEELPAYEQALCNEIWRQTAHFNAGVAKELSELGLHKQTTNRLMENFTHTKMVISGTEWNNFFALRNHKDAQPEFQDLARCMFEAKQQSVSQALYSDEWHLPYIESIRDFDSGDIIYLDSNGDHLTEEEALKISASCCAQVSYRKLDDTKEKAIEIFERMFTSVPLHSSPAEHQAKVLKIGSVDINNMHPDTWEKGITHMCKDYDLWSANFKNFVQYRQTLANHYVKG